MLDILLKWGGAGLFAGTLVAGGAAGVDHLLVSNHAELRANAEHTSSVAIEANPSPDLPHPNAPRAPKSPGVGHAGQILHAGGAPNKE